MVQQLCHKQFSCNNDSTVAKATTTLYDVLQ